MIVEMTRLRLLGPRAKLRPALTALQDLGAVHLVEPSFEGVRANAPSSVDRRRRRHLERVLADVEAALDNLVALGATARPERGRALTEAAAARLARRARNETDTLRAREAALSAERDTLQTFEPLFGELEDLYRRTDHNRLFSAYLLLIRGDATKTVERLRAALTAILGDAFELQTRPLGRATAVILLAPGARAEPIEQLLAEARIEQMAAPPGIDGADLFEALPRMRPRLDAVKRELRSLRDRAGAAARSYGSALLRARHMFHDELLELSAEQLAGDTGRAFVIEGWLPAGELPRLRNTVERELGGDVAVEEVSREQWTGDPAPVVLQNPRVFEPFERLTSLLPLPRYGSVDPTPFVAVFFPMLFGIVVGDIGYGVLMAAIGGLLWWRSAPGGLARDVARIMTAVSAFVIIFGALYGELFGDVGARWWGLEPLLFDRAEAVIPFLVGAVALGGVHLVLGLIVGAISERRSAPRKALGRGITVVMLLLVGVALLAVFELLPSKFFTPAIVALLVAFPALIVAEGFTAPLELLSLFGHVLSYARVMALGTASVMLAVVANRMVGAIGSVAVGMTFALLFHLVNFAIALFSPTIHVLRLHYVEFFGTFYSPGGTRYHPLTHWSPEPEG